VRVRIRDVVSVAGGGTPKRSTADYYGGPIPWVTPKDMKAAVITGSQVTLTEAGLRNSPAKLVPEGSTLVVVRSGVLKHTLPVALSALPVSLNQDMKALIPGAQVHAPWLSMLVKSLEPKVLSWVRATTADNFPIDNLLDLVVDLPPLEEQRRIAAVVEKAADLVASQTRMAGLLDTLAGAVFAESFGEPIVNPKGWRVAPLEEVCLGKGKYGANVPSVDYSPELPRYVRITDISENGVLLPEPRSPGGDRSAWSDYALEAGDLLFARSGATVGKTYLFRGTEGAAVYAGYLIRFRPNPKIVRPDYIFAYTKTESYRAWVKSHANVVAQPNINAKQYGRELLIPVPPLELQDVFVKHLEAIDGMRRLTSARLASLDLVAEATAARAFAGDS